MRVGGGDIVWGFQTKMGLRLWPSKKARQKGKRPGEGSRGEGTGNPSIGEDRQSGVNGQNTKTGHHKSTLVVEPKLWT